MPKATSWPCAARTAAEIARGLTNYGHEDLDRIKGLRTSQIADVLGECPYEEVIHRDNMVVTGTGGVMKTDKELHMPPNGTNY